MQCKCNQYINSLKHSQCFYHVYWYTRYLLNKISHKMLLWYWCSTFKLGRTGSTGKMEFFLKPSLPKLDREMAHQPFSSDFVKSLSHSPQIDSWQQFAIGTLHDECQEGESLPPSFQTASVLSSPTPHLSPREHDSTATPGNPQRPSLQEPPLTVGSIPITLPNVFLLLSQTSS